jgi:hypothetical protein
MLRAYQISKRFRERGIPVIFGGPNFTLHADEAKKHADSVMLGEAETTWERVLSDARRGRLEPIYDSTPLDDLSGLPVPSYDLFNSRPEFRDALFTVQASRGCPHRCDFCAISALTQGRVRFRPIDDVIRDVKATGRKRIFFADDNLMARPQYYMELFERLIPLKIHWVGATTLNIGRRPEMLKLARRSGCTLLIVGVESIAQDVLNGVRKSFNHTKDYEEQIGNIFERRLFSGGLIRKLRELQVALVSVGEQELVALQLDVHPDPLVGVVLERDGDLGATGRDRDRRAGRNSDAREEVVRRGADPGEQGACLRATASRLPGRRERREQRAFIACDARVAGTEQVVDGTKVQQRAAELLCRHRCRGRGRAGCERPRRAVGNGDFGDQAVDRDRVD